MTNKKNYKEQETIKERGSKRYRERLIEEEEAERLIKEYQYNDAEEYIDNDEQQIRIQE